MAGDDDPVFMHTMNLGGNGRMLVRDNGMGVEEVVGVYSDIEALKPRPFAEVHGLDFSTDGTNDAPEVTHEALAIAGDDMAVLGRVMSAAFTAGSAATLRFTHDNPDTQGTDEARELDGTYDGAAGTYRCNGAAECTVEIGANGGITAMSTGWIFTPDPGATVDVRDINHVLHYGFWLKKTTDDEGAITYNEVETFRRFFGRSLRQRRFSQGAGPPMKAALRAFMRSGPVTTRAPENSSAQTPVISRRTPALRRFSARRTSRTSLRIG